MTDDVSDYVVGPESIDPLSVYQITNFFTKHPSVTPEDCARTALDITGSSTSPTLVQGQFSYTVATNQADPPQVIQFRHTELDLDVLKQARETYRKFVPRTESCGMLGDVYVYKSDLVPGVAFVRARKQLFSVGMEHCLLRTVRDFARFFAVSWIAKPKITLAPEVIEKLKNHYTQILNQLITSLPSQFHTKLNSIQTNLPLLFSPTYPIVLHHTDLHEMNIHVSSSGALTGIVDWADTIIAPFGVSLVGLETLLGVETGSAWLFHHRHLFLRQEFWRTFYGVTGELARDEKRAIEAARLLGVFWEWGFDGRPDREGEGARVVREGGHEFMCLESLVLRTD